MTSNDFPSISLVIPAHNREAGIIKTLRLLASILEGYEYEILVVVNNSSDMTAQKVEWYRKHVNSKIVAYSISNGSKAQSLEFGFQRCRGGVWGFVDADFGDVKPEAKVAQDLTNMLQLIVMNKADFVMGNRTRRYRKQNRWAISQPYNFLGRLLYGFDVRDANCGVKFFTREVGEQITKKASFRGFEVDIELISWTHWYGYRIIPYSVEWDNSAGAGLLATVDLMILGVSMAINLLLLRLRSAFIQIKHRQEVQM